MATRALVLSGGGPVGIAWESGIVAGLAEEGVLLGDADLIVGTSAGSVVGAQLALGQEPAKMLASQLAPRPAGAAAAAAARGTPDLTPLMGFMARAFTEAGPAEALRAQIGAFALQARTAPEESFIAGFANRLGTTEWPRRSFICTATDCLTGEFKVWDRDSGIELPRAVASSCAVPGIFPPITIDGRRYYDGGIRSATNADLARGHEIVVIIAVSGAGASDDPRAAAFRARLDGEVEGLRGGGSRLVELISADEGSREAFGVNLMDGSRNAGAAEAGLRQGRAEAARLKALWT